MEQLLRMLQQELRALRTQVEDRLSALERNSRLPTPEPIVVPDEPEEKTTTVDPGANAGADGGAGTQQTSTIDPPAGGAVDDPAGGATDPTAETSKPKSGKGKAADQTTGQTDPAQVPAA